MTLQCSLVLGLSICWLPAHRSPSFYSIPKPQPTCYETFAAVFLKAWASPFIHSRFSSLRSSLNDHICRPWPDWHIFVLFQCLFFFLFLFCFRVCVYACKSHRCSERVVGGTARLQKTAWWVTAGCWINSVWGVPGIGKQGQRGPVFMVSPGATLAAQTISISCLSPFPKQTKIDPNCSHCINF